MKKQILICLLLVGSTLTIKAQWDLSSNYVLYRQTDSNQIIFKSSRTDNTLEGTLSTDGWGSFAFNRNLSIGGYISNIGDASKTIYRTVRTDNTLEGTLSTDGWGSFAFNRNLSIGGYISNIGDASKIIYRTIRTDNTLEGTLSTDGWGNFTFNKKVSIGTNNITDHQLNVCGTVRANEVKVDLTGCDFVFENDYKLLSLNELEKFIKEHKHLPEIASAKEMEKDGTDLGNLSSNLLKKVEELTLYILEQNKRIDQQNEKIVALGDEIKKMNKK